MDCCVFPKFDAACLNCRRALSPKADTTVNNVLK